MIFIGILFDHAIQATMTTENDVGNLLFADAFDQMIYLIGVLTIKI